MATPGVNCSKVHTILLLICCIVSGMLMGCNSGESFPIGKEFMLSDARVMAIDTFQVESATVMLDSIPTSGTGQALAGYHSDMDFGKITCSSYFQLGLPESYSVEEEDVYDSVSLILPYSGYYYGDTLQEVGLSVHRLTESLELFSTGYLYSTNSFTCDSRSYGDIHFYPAPVRDDSVEISLDPGLGFPFFRNLTLEPEYYDSDNAFLKYLKGFVIVPLDLSSGPIVGFNSGDGEIKMRLYYHDPAESDKVLHVDYPLINTKNQFNHVVHDFAGTPLDSIRDPRRNIASSTTGNLSFVQGGTALYTRISFPSLQEIRNFNRGTILRAELVIYPHPTSYSSFGLPETLSLFLTNEKNTLISAATNSDGESVTASLLLDEWYHENTSYTFSLTNYVLSEMKDEYYDPGHALLIGPSDNDLQSSLSRVVFTAESPKPVLRLYYVTY
ncbi:MAG: DUF4270 family protein [Bacteroidales bacterium]